MPEIKQQPEHRHAAAASTLSLARLVAADARNEVGAEAPDFTMFSPDALAAFAESHRHELHAEGVTAADITNALAQGRAEIELRRYGFAVIEVTPGRAPGTQIPHLWLLYVNPSARGQGWGSRFVEELLEKYSTDYHMSLWCYGPKRVRFFERLGFVVGSRDGGMRHMTTNMEYPD